ncbi:MAG: hypothetical protein QOH42_1356 [Blastocatellia bacterium]|nr:hypothetical protein [Blastocatellia bacterium]
MNDNYLWDRSGKPDPEIQKLEEILGTLRYQPRTLEIPPDLHVGRRRNLFPAMAIAAAIVLLAVVLGLWLNFNRRQAQAIEVKTTSPVTQPLNPATPTTNQDGQTPLATAVKSPTQTGVQKRELPRSLQARNRNSSTRTVIRQAELTPEELAEKEQVLVALRLVSYKLNLAQRRTQGFPQLNQIRNQHKIG